ncbi:hypothetical protein HYY71_00520 [Candidatus Woesearchaeota archaeon]|nr:hypothetical protein [Candidatus Woesearchaeota archaeon]
MEKISEFERNRQLFHIFFGIFIVLLVMYDGIIGFILFFLFGIVDSNGILNSKNTILILIVVGLALSYMSRKIKIPIINQLLQKFERKRELYSFPGKGLIFYLTGAYVSLLLFPRDIAIASIMVLALGDSVSHLYGLHYGRIRHPLSKTKFLEGTIAGLIFGFIGAFVFLPWHEAFFASLAAMIVEAVEIRIGAQQVDDNLIIPFVAGAAVWIVRMV